MNRLLKNGFTLVELIVVITILAILGTIAFVTLQTWTKSSRNSVRISDMSVISHGLEIYVATHAKYPSPSGAVTITYSGANVWEQGTFGQDSSRGLNSLSNVPVDPVLGTEYAYSVTSQGSEYEIGGVLETGTLISANPLYSQTYADTGFKAIKEGNYNGNVIRTSTGGYDYILAVPTILASDTSNTNLLDIIQNKRLVFDGYKTPPAGVGISQEDFIDFHSSFPDSIVIFSGSLEDINSQEQKLLIAQNLKTVYTSTGTQDNPSYGIFASIDVDTEPAAAMEKAEDILLGQLKLESLVSRQTYEEVGGPILLLPVCESALTQIEADELNFLTGKANSIAQWCSEGRLDLSNQGTLMTIPSGAFKLTQITNLNLEKNNFSSLPSEMQNFTNLTTLNIGSNLFSSYPSVINNLNSLVSLTLSANYIDNLNGIDNLVNLEYIDASNNALTDMSILLNIPTLSYIDVSDNNIGSSIFGLDFSGMTQLETLGLAQNNIPSGFSFPSDLMYGNTTLKNLYLSDNALSSNGFGFSTQFEKLYLAGNSSMGDCAINWEAYTDNISYLCPDGSTIGVNGEGQIYYTAGL